MDKKKYITPETEIVEFDMMDVIVTSGESPEDDETIVVPNITGV